MTSQNQPRAEPLLPYTRATAHDAGWQWRIPLQHRTGNGVVYSSAHWSDGRAADHLLANLDGKAQADPRPIRFTTGKRRQPFAHNVVALGLAAGFMEPLESTSLHLVQSAIARLLKLLPGAAAGAAHRDAFNRQSDAEWTRIRDFLILHYRANARDGDFWSACRDTSPPDTLAAKLALWREEAALWREDEELFTEVAWAQVLIGQGVIPSRWHPLADGPSDAEAVEYCDLIHQLAAREVAQMPEHGAFVSQHCAVRG